MVEFHFYSYSIFNSILRFTYLMIFVLGLDKIEYLQSHKNIEIYQKAFDIIEHYFGSEEEDGRIAPCVSSSNDQFQFNSDQSVPMGGFQF